MARLPTHPHQKKDMEYKETRDTQFIRDAHHLTVDPLRREWTGENFFKIQDFFRKDTKTLARNKDRCICQKYT